MGFVKVGDQSSKVAPSTANKRVLYVEDEDTNWEVAEMSLRDRFELSRATTARDTILRLTLHQYDLILMDIQLQGSDYDGIALTRILRGIHPGPLADYCKTYKPITTPIIFVTAYSARYKREELIAAGGDELMTKPVDFTRLTLAMSRLILKQVKGNG